MKSSATDYADLPVGHCMITGHSRGLGAALCRQLLDRGWQVLALARTCAESWTSLTPKSLQQINLDLSDLDALQVWLAGDTLSAFLGPARHALLINNAGVVNPVGAAGQLDSQSLNRCMAINTTAPLLLTNAWLAQTRHCADRRVLHISSGAARSAYAGWSTYGASKAALDHHARCVAADQLPNLRIASLAPGVIDTDMQAELRRCDPAGFPMKQRFVDLKTHGHLSEPDTAAKATLDYLLSDAFGSQAAPDIRQLG